MSLGKITEGKLEYELYWEFITLLAERMAKNKHKYEKYSWKQPVDVESLKQAYFRHTLEIMKGNYDDEGLQYHHISAATANLMMIYYQLKQGEVKEILKMIRETPATLIYKEGYEKRLRECVEEYSNDQELGQKIRELVK